MNQTETEQWKQRLKLTERKKQKGINTQHHFLKATTEIKSGRVACYLRKCKNFQSPTHLNPRKITDFSVLE